MVPQKLFEYISNKKKDGYPDSMIKSQFIKQGWPIEVLDEAYARLNNQLDIYTSPSTTATDLPNISTFSSQPTAPETAPQAQIAQSKTEHTEIPKKWLLSLTVLFILLSSQFQSIASKLLFIMIIFQKSIMTIGSSQSILTMYPTLYIGVIFLCMTSLYIFYLSAKIRNFSTESWKLGIGSVIVAPVLTYPFINLLALPLFKQAALMGNKDIQFIYPGIDLFYIFVILAILWYTKNLHNNENQNISKKAKIWFGIACTITIFTVSIAGYVLSQTKGSPDMDYQKISDQATHKVYKIENLPSNLEYGSPYTIDQDTNGESMVKFALDTPLSQQTGNNSQLIVITQQKSTTSYDVTKEFTRNEAPIKTLPLPIAVLDVAYIAKDGFLNKLEFVTKDGVLIKILSPKASEETLIELAKLLK